MAPAARKVTAKDANEKLAHRRLTVLELAERLGKTTVAARDIPGLRPRCWRRAGP